MCLDVKRDYFIRNESETLETQIINSYALNELVIFKEFICKDVDFNYFIRKCSCSNEIRTLYHTYAHFDYLVELTLSSPNRTLRHRTFFNIHQDFELIEYLIKINGKVCLKLNHRESGFDYFISFDFPSDDLIIKREFFTLH